MFREGKCPRCHETIQVPEGREKILCMFCGSEILVDEALGEKRRLDREACEENSMKAEKALALFVSECREPMKDFTRDTYTDVFDTFYREHLELFKALELAYQNAQDPEGKLKELARSLIEAADADVKALRFKGNRTRRQLDLNLQICAYLIPAALRYAAESSEPFADCLVESWNQAFGTTIGKASYEEIEKGFRRKLCYITTAVCKSLGKGQDCRELQILKDYRDQYLEQTPEGRAMVEEYYDVAPTLVKRMDRQEGRDRLYQELYQEYVEPCLEDIEAGRYEACRQRYQEMVGELRTRFMGGD